MRHLFPVLASFLCLVSFHASVASEPGALHSKPSRIVLRAGHLGGPGKVDGSGTSARFSSPGAMAADSAGNLYVSDLGNQIIRKITPSGKVTTLRCKCGKQERIAWFLYAKALTVDARGNLYAIHGEAVVKLTPEGIMTVVAGDVSETGSADGMSTQARFDLPEGLTIDASGVLYVADTGNHTIRKITPGGMVSTLAGKPGSEGRKDGKGPMARFNEPIGLSMTASGQILVADRKNFTFRQVSSDGRVTTPRSSTPKGKTPRALALPLMPQSLAVDAAGNIHLLARHTGFSDSDYWRVSAKGVAEAISYERPSLPYQAEEAEVPGYAWHSVAADSKGNVFFSSSHDHAIYKLASGAEKPALFAGQPPEAGGEDGQPSSARFWEPGGVAMDAQGNVYLADTNNATIRKITPDGHVSTFAGKPGQTGHADGKRDQARFSRNLAGMALGPAGDLFVLDDYSIRKISADGTVSTFLENMDLQQNGQIVQITSRPGGLAVDADGNLYVSLPTGGCILKITPARDKEIFAGQWKGFTERDGAAAKARFHSPNALAMDSGGNLWVADDEHVRRISREGQVTTLHGYYGSPGGLAVDRAGNLFVVDTREGVIREWTRGDDFSLLVSPAAEPLLPCPGSSTPNNEAERYRFAALGVTPSGDLIATIANAVVGISTAQPHSDEIHDESQARDCLAPPTAAVSPLEEAAGLYSDFQKRIAWAREALASRASKPGEVQPVLTQAEFEKLFEASVVPGSLAAKLLGQMFSAEEEAVQRQDYEAQFLALKKRLFLFSGIEEARPAGFGGKGSALDRPGMRFQGEIWYVHIQGMSPETKGRLVGDGKPFRKWRLPQANSLEREVFPFLVFQREDGRIRLEAFSREFMAAVGVP